MISFSLKGQKEIWSSLKFSLLTYFSRFSQSSGIFFIVFLGAFLFFVFVCFFFFEIKVTYNSTRTLLKMMDFSVYLYGRIIFIWYSMVANSKFICKTIRSCIVSNSALIFWSTFCKYMFSYKWSESLYAKGSYPHVFPWPLGIAFPALWKRLFYGNPLTFPNHAPSTTYTYIA